MKTNKFVTAGKLLAFLFLSIVVMPSCSKDDDASPAYVGTWQIESEGLDLAPKLKTTVPPLHFRTVLTLNEASYVRTYENKYTTNGWTIVDGEKGSLTVASDIFTITTKQTSEFVDELDQTKGIKYVDLPAGELESFKVKWSVIGNKLTVTTDGNNDGDFNDTETYDDYQEVFTKM